MPFLPNSTVSELPSQLEAPIPIAIHAGAGAAAVAASTVSSGHIPRVLELVQFLSVFCSSLSSQQQERVSVFQVASLTGLALSRADACQICPSRCYEPSFMVEPMFALICVLAAVTSVLIIFDAFKAQKLILAGIQESNVTPVDANAIQRASMQQRIALICIRCARSLIETSTSYVLMPAMFVCVLNVTPSEFTKAGALQQFMTVSTLVIAPVLRTIVIYKRFVNMTDSDQKQLHVTSACTCLISIVLGLSFVKSRQNYHADELFASDTLSQLIVLAFLMFQLASHSIIRLRASQASVMDNINMPWYNADGKEFSQKISFEELRIRLVQSSFRKLFLSSVAFGAKFVLMNYLTLSQIMMVLAGLITSIEKSISKIEAAAITIGVIPLVNSGLLLSHSVSKMAKWLWRKAVSRWKQQRMPLNPLGVAPSADTLL
jgi:hypothetical protein